MKTNSRERVELYVKFFAVLIAFLGAAFFSTMQNEIAYTELYGASLGWIAGLTVTFSLSVSGFFHGLKFIVLRYFIVFVSVFLTVFSVSTKEIRQYEKRETADPVVSMYKGRIETLVTDNQKNQALYAQTAAAGQNNGAKFWRSRMAQVDSAIAANTIELETRRAYLRKYTTPRREAIVRAIEVFTGEISSQRKLTAIFVLYDALMSVIFDILVAVLAVLLVGLYEELFINVPKAEETETPEEPEPVHKTRKTVAFEKAVNCATRKIGKKATRDSIISYLHENSEMLGIKIPKSKYYFESILDELNVVKRGEV